MKKHLYKTIASSILLLLLIFLNAKVYAQKSATADGIRMEFLELNEKEFYYGEPIRILYKYVNTTNSKVFYYKPNSYNYNTYLVNIATQDTINPNFGLYRPSARGRYRIRNVKPSDPYEYFSAGEESISFKHISTHYGTEKLSSKPVQGNVNTFTGELNVLPAGKYELTLKYELWPGNHVLQVSYQFEVVPIPTDEQRALEAYTATIAYAGKDLRRIDNSYSTSHPNSFENFLKKFPNSIYADHAYLNMMDFYKFTFRWGSPTEKEHLAKFKEFLAYYPHLKKDFVKLKYLDRVPDLIFKVAPENYEKETDLFLKGMENNNPDFSKKFINMAEREAKSEKIKKPNFKNYAQEREDKEDKR